MNDHDMDIQKICGSLIWWLKLQFLPAISQVCSTTEVVIRLRGDDRQDSFLD